MPEEKVETVETPTPTPATEPAETKAEDLGSDVFTDFANEDLGAEVEEIVKSDDTPPPAKEEPKGEQPPVDKTPAQRAAEAVQALEKPASDQPPATPPKSETPPPAVETPPATPQKTPEEIKAEREQSRKKYFDELAQGYALSEEDANAVITDPEKVLPRLLAKVHMDVADRMAQWVATSFPHFMQAHSQRAQAVETSTKLFFSEWPELNKPEYAPVVARVLSGYRQANPTASAEDVIREGGVASLVALRIPLPQRLMEKHNVDTPDAARPGGTPVVPSGSGATPPPARKSSNAFEVLAEEDLVDDRG